MVIRVETCETEIMHKYKVWNCFFFNENFCPIPKTTHLELINYFCFYTSNRIHRQLSEAQDGLLGYQFLGQRTSGWPLREVQWGDIVYPCFPKTICCIRSFSPTPLGSEMTHTRQKKVVRVGFFNRIPYIVSNICIHLIML